MITLKIKASKPADLNHTRAIHLLLKSKNIISLPFKQSELKQMKYDAPYICFDDHGKGVYGFEHPVEKISIKKCADNELSITATSLWREEMNQHIRLRTAAWETDFELLFHAVYGKLLDMKK